MRRHLGPEFPLMVDANMRWSVDEAIRAARALGELARSGWRSRPSPTTSRATCASCEKAGFL
jgi:L-alanine-DL-glutamate epimerase-like enolase superfamily enzyme